MVNFPESRPFSISVRQGVDPVRALILLPLPPAPPPHPNLTAQSKVGGCAQLIFDARGGPSQPLLALALSLFSPCILKKQNFFQHGKNYFKYILYLSNVYAS